MLTPVSDSPFAVLTLIAAPAVFTNASSVLALGTGNRLARVVDRTRMLVKDLHGAEIDPRYADVVGEPSWTAGKTRRTAGARDEFLLQRYWLFRGGQRGFHSGRKRGIHKIHVAV